MVIKNTMNPKYRRNHSKTLQMQILEENQPKFSFSTQIGVHTVKMQNQNGINSKRNMTER